MLDFASTEYVNRKDAYHRTIPEILHRKEYMVKLERGEDGWVVAKCPQLNVVTQGKTREEVEKNVIEAIELVLDEISPKDNAFTIRII